MADGTDRRPDSRPLLRECAACQRAKATHHACGFLNGVFQPSNWGCASLAKLDKYAAVVEGDEVDVLVIERSDGGMVLLTRRVGEPQRIRTAQVVTTHFQVRPLTIDDVELLIGVPG